MILTGLERHTVISIGYDRVLDHNIIATIDIPAIGVGRAMRWSRDSVDCNVVEDYVFALVYLAFCLDFNLICIAALTHQVVPFWSIDHLDIFYGDICGLEERQDDRATERRVRRAVEHYVKLDVV